VTPEEFPSACERFDSWRLHKFVPSRRAARHLTALPELGSLEFVGGSVGTRRRSAGCSALSACARNLWALGPEAARRMRPHRGIGPMDFWSTRRYRTSSPDTNAPSTRSRRRTRTQPDVTGAPDATTGARLGRRPGGRPASGREAQAAPKAHPSHVQRMLSHTMPSEPLGPCDSATEPSAARSLPRTFA
jgi:hypothetical protein